MLYSGIHYVVVATILLRENSIKSAVGVIKLVIFKRKSYVFRSFSRFVFYLVFKSCWNFQSFSECRLIVFILTKFFQFFEGSKNAILGKNHRQGSRSGSRNRAWTKTFFWCILKRDKDSKIPGPQFSYENESFLSLKLFRAMQFIIFTCRFQVWNCVDRSVTHRNL